MIGDSCSSSFVMKWKVDGFVFENETEVEGMVVREVVVEVVVLG